MARFILRRIGETIPLLLLLSLLVFLLFQMIPGDYLTTYAMDPSVPSAVVKEVRHELGLDQPVLIQYGRWLMALARGDLGYSFAERRPATAIIVERLFNTLMLSLGALFLTFVIAVPASALASQAPGGWVDRLSGFVSLTGLSLTTVLSSLFFLYLAFRTGWFTLSPDRWDDLFLPCLTLAVPAGAFLFKMLRAELIEVERQHFMQAARARGLSRIRLFRHAVRNAINPAVSLLGVMLGGLLSGSVVVEKVFGWPGIGALTVESILSRDLFVALNCVLVSAVLVVASNLVADLLLAAGDPRIRDR